MACGFPDIPAKKSIREQSDLQMKTTGNSFPFFHGMTW